MNREHSVPASRRIEILREDVSRKIAAGEVIDRPFSVIRELLDNSIDAGADSVDVYIEGGGIDRIIVVDNGAGMSREDLELCSERHATSKIREEGDLYRVRTLGFRGEALASVAACSRLEIISKQGEVLGEGEAAAAVTAPAYRLRVEGGKRQGVEQWRGNPGTVVTVSDLFYNLPVRRKFLKSKAGETGTCRQTFVEKAVAFPRISFRFFSDGKLKSFLAPRDQKQRVAEAFELQQEHLSLLEAEAPSLRLRIVAARPELSRRDRRLVQIYVNRRRIFEYGLVHAVEYAYGGYMPGGQHPITFVFLELDPQLVDFNIHPAKREARFRDLPGLHQLLSSTLKDYLGGFDLKGPRPAGGPAQDRSGGGALRFPVELIPRPPQRSAEEEASGAAEQEAGAGFEAGAQLAAGPAIAAETPVAEQPAAAVEPVYRGQLFRLFLLVEYGDSLYVVDQHAAHERILFEQLKAAQPAGQELLMPIRLEIGANAAEAIAERKGLFQRLGIRVEQSDDGAFEITSLPEALLSIEEEELVKALLWEKGSVDDLVDRMFSLAACRLAVKEGRDLDPLTAAELTRRVFQLTNARCPHGRPIWFEISRERLMREVGRT